MLQWQGIKNGMYAPVRIQEMKLQLSQRESESDSRLIWSRGGAGDEQPARQCRRNVTQMWPLGQEDSLEKRHGNPLQYSCLENPMDRGAWKARLQRVGHGWCTQSYDSWFQITVPDPNWKQSMSIHGNGKIYNKTPKECYVTNFF